MNRIVKNIDKENSKNIAENDRSQPVNEFKSFGPELGQGGESADE